MKKALLIMILTLGVTASFAETVVDVYEMSYAEADALGTNYDKIYKKTQELAPATSSVYKNGKLSKIKRNFHSRGVSIVFATNKTDIEKFNILLEAVAKFSRTKMKSKDGVGMSKMLLQLKQ